jgi:hypothetical protein
VKNIPPTALATDLSKDDAAAEFVLASAAWAAFTCAGFDSAGALLTPLVECSMRYLTSDAIGVLWCKSLAAFFQQAHGGTTMQRAHLVCNC